MNERIKKLAEQADAYADAMDYLGKNYIGLRDNYFAELIVKKCANIVRNSSLPDSYSEACLEYIADELEEHFGVEP
jgi:hypothetical protein